MARFWPGADAGAEVGDGVRTGSEAAVLAFHQAEGPGVAVAAALRHSVKQQWSGMHVGTDENGLAILKNLIEAGDADVGEILGVVVGTCLVDGVVNDVMHGANRHVDAEEIAAKFVNAAIGTSWQRSVKARAACLSQCLLIGNWKST